MKPYLFAFPLLFFSCPDNDMVEPFPIPEDPCLLVNCYNEGVCENGICACSWPYMGEDCTRNILDALNGTYAYFTGEDKIEYFITISTDTRTGEVEITNILNANAISRGRFDANGEVNFNSVEAIAYNCHSFDEINVQLESVEKEGTVVNLYVSSYIEYCNGNPFFHYRASSQEFRKINDDPCQGVYLNSCVNNLNGLVTGRYVLDSDLTTFISTPVFPVHEITLYNIEENIRVQNAFNSNDYLLLRADGFNQWSNIQNRSLQINEFWPMSTSANLTRGFTTPDGQYFILQTLIYYDQSGDFCCSDQFVYKRI